LFVVGNRAVDDRDLLLKAFVVYLALGPSLIKGLKCSSRIALNNFVAMLIFKFRW